MPEKSGDDFNNFGVFTIHTLSSGNICYRFYISNVLY